MKLPVIREVSIEKRNIELEREKDDNIIKIEDNDNIAPTKTVVTEVKIDQEKEEEIVTPPTMLMTRTKMIVSIEAEEMEEMTVGETTHGGMVEIVDLGGTGMRKTIVVGAKMIDVPSRA